MTAVFYSAPKPPHIYKNARVLFYFCQNQRPSQKARDTKYELQFILALDLILSKFPIRE